MNNSPNFLESCELLGLNPDELILKPTLHDNTLENVKSRVMQLNAATKLSVCMMAWNKEDEFEPDEKATYLQENAGYTPHFYFKGGKLLSSGYANLGSYAGLVFVSAYYAAAYTYAHLGLRLCLSTQKRAVQFGEVFVDIFNELV